MSLSSIDQASKDEALISRTVSCCVQESYENAAVGTTAFAGQVKSNANFARPMVWPVAIANEAEYESALAAGNPDPGGDPAVITDGMILSAVQAEWPAG